MAKYYSYTIWLKGARTTDGSPWSYSTRAPDAETAKLTAAKWYQLHKTPMGRKPQTLVRLMSGMTAKRR